MPVSHLSLFWTKLLGIDTYKQHSIVMSGHSPTEPQVAVRFSMWGRPARGPDAPNRFYGNKEEISHT